MIHPYLDLVSQIEEYKEKYNPAAFKIHGTGSGIEPQKISVEIINALRKCDIPLIFHTDYSRKRFYFTE